MLFRCIAGREKDGRSHIASALAMKADVLVLIVMVLLLGLLLTLAVFGY
jgi:hypothetical protein